MAETKKKIIVVDDEKSIRDLVREVLEEEGYEVDTAINGIDGIKKIKELVPDLVIVDIMMPLMNGYHMVNELVNDEDINKLPEFLILTVRSKKLDNGLGERIGACVYLEKPFRREILVRLVQEILKGRNWTAEENAGYDNS